jgi:hypothetical protein
VCYLIRHFGEVVDLSPLQRSGVGGDGDGDGYRIGDVDCARMMMVIGGRGRMLGGVRKVNHDNEPSMAEPCYASFFTQICRCMVGVGVVMAMVMVMVTATRTVLVMVIGKSRDSVGEIRVNHR